MSFDRWTDALHDIDAELVLRRAAGDEVLGRLLVQIGELDPFVAGEVIGEPGLAALGFASDPVAQDVALVGVSLPLDCVLDVLMASALAGESGAVGGYAFDAQVQPLRSGECER